MPPTATPAIDAARRAELREAFAQFDEDHDGRMQLDEFVHFIGNIDANMTDEDCRIGFHEIDVNRDGVVQFEEFLQWWITP